ncbi:MFS transporter [Citricoccus sp. GCM10030269]|uniref:MFS transporter n=1 Tax=Citricoccus sp. GCM10030269 TaxID=3273388 RepID=UPI00360981AD
MSASSSPSPSSPSSHVRPRLDTPAKRRRYEQQAVIVLALGFGLVGLDRWIISPLFPAIMADLDLGYADLGNIVGALGLAWGISALFMGRLSDRFGRRRVMVPGIMVFSLFSVFTGLAGGLLSLVLIRAFMGITEGAFGPTAVAATAEASRPERRGFNMGFQQSTFALFGIGLGPIIATQLLEVLPSWRWVFAVMIIPGLVLAYFTWRVIREPGELEEDAPPPTELPDAVLDAAEEDTRRYPWYEVFKHRNIVVIMLALCGAMTCIFVLSSMVPSYLTDHQLMNLQDMGLATSGIGFGAFVGQLIIPGISDRIGRKPAALIALAFGAITMVVFLLQGPNVLTTFLLLFAVALGVNGTLALVAATVSVESVPPALMATAAGTVMGIGEIFGGGVAPVVAGHLAGSYGIQSPLYLAMGGILFAFIMVLFLRETAPSKVSRRRRIAEQSTPV